MIDSRPEPARPGLDDSPVAHIMLDADGTLRWANTAAVDLLGAKLAQQGQGLAAALGLPELTVRAEPLFAPAIGRWLRLRRAELPDGRCLLALEDAQAQVQARDAAERLATLLDIAGELGRLGTWSRDARTLQGRWDRHMFPMWGLDEAAGTPDFELVTAAIVDGDREALQAHFRASLLEPGTYDRRYRVRRPDGSIGRLHSQWVVRAGPDGMPGEVLGVLMDDTDAWRLAQAHDVRQSEMALAEDLMDLSRWRLDLQTQRMHYNRRSYDMLGIAPRPEGLAVDEVRALVHPDDLPRVMASAEHTLRTGEPTDFEARYRRADGHWLEVVNRRALERDALGQPVAFIGVSMDLTRLRAAKRRSHELADRLDLAARSAGIGYWNLEGGQSRPTWNTQMWLIHGLPEGTDVPSFHVWLETLVHPDDRPQVGHEFRRLGRDERREINAEFRILRPDGGVRRVLTHTRVEPQGEHANLFGIAVDVTERWQADQALRGAGERVALAARGAGIGTFEVNLETGAVAWDEQMWRLRGLEPQTDPPTAELSQSLPVPEDREYARKLMSAHRLAKDAVSGEFRIRWPDGQLRWLATRSTLMQGGPGQAARRIGINWDVTEARRAEAERSEREAAEQASRAKSDFLSRVSHELRTPMNAVLGFTQLLLARADDDDAVARRSQLQQVLAAGEHLLQLINDVLDLTAVEAGRMQFRHQAVPIGPLLGGALELVESMRLAHGLPAIEVAGDEATALADPTRLRQVLLNLLTNAIKYNRPGGWVAVDIEAAGGQVRLRVRDGGVGLTTEQQKDLFQPFNRLGHESQAIEGSGIGLAIAKALVERMGGTLEARSLAGAGSVFTVTLAQADPTPAPTAPPASATPGPSKPEAPGLQGKVLYIEDNPVNAMLVKEMLACAGQLELIEAADGRSGVERARRHRPDLVLVDMHLPDFDGHEVLRQLRADPATAALRCVALSANAMPEDIERARQAGFVAYWTKPLELAAFLSSMRNLLADAQAAGE